MKTWPLKNLLFVLFTLVLAGCGEKKNDSQPVSIRGPGYRSNMMIAGMNLVGRIGVSGNYQSEFQDAVAGLLSTDVAPQYIGYVSASPSPQSGVSFGGQVSFSNGTLRNASMNGGYLTVNPASRLVVQVQDYVPQYPNAALLPPITLANAEGSISGNSAELRFSDQYGMITLRGEFDQNQFTGVISYDNFVMYDGTTPGAAGVLGDFSIPTCAFFVCQ